MIDHVGRRLRGDVRPTPERPSPRATARRPSKLMHTELDKAWRGERQNAQAGWLSLREHRRRHALDQWTVPAFSEPLARDLSLPLAGSRRPASRPCGAKPTNAPNKFMGSGMLPAGAYVTLEPRVCAGLQERPEKGFRKRGRQREDAPKARSSGRSGTRGSRTVWDPPRNPAEPGCPNLPQTQRSVPVRAGVPTVETCSRRMATPSWDPLPWHRNHHPWPRVAAGRKQRGRRNRSGIVHAHQGQRGLLPSRRPPPRVHKRIVDHLDFVLRTRPKKREGKSSISTRTTKFPVMTRQETELRPL